MILVEPGLWRVEGAIRMANARQWLEEGVAALREGELVIDLEGVTAADSSAVAVMLGWLRAATAVRSTVRFAHIPPGVRALAELYGVSELLLTA